MAYLLMRCVQSPHRSPRRERLIGASNFFELAVAVAITLFGPAPGRRWPLSSAVLVEVPVMLSVRRIGNGSRTWHEEALPPGGRREDGDTQRDLIDAELGCQRLPPRRGNGTRSWLPDIATAGNRRGVRLKIATAERRNAGGVGCQVELDLIYRWKICRQAAPGFGVERSNEPAGALSKAA